MRIRAPHAIGSGTIIGPHLIVTAAHVVSLGPGQGDVGASALRVLTMYGAPVVFRVLDIRVAKPWADDQPAARINDIAVLHVDPAAASPLSYVKNFGADAVAPLSATAFGYVGDALVQARYRSGTVSRDGTAFFSSDIDADEGMSGGALVTREEAPRLVGVVRSRPASPGQAAVIALPFIAEVFDPLVAVQAQKESPA